MKANNSRYFVAIMLATAAMLNIQAVSARTPEKLFKSREAVKKADLPAVLSENINYPAEAIHRKLQGIVKVMAVIEPDGTVSGIRIMQDIGGSCADEVSRTIRKMRFDPLIENGVATRYALVLKVNFKLEK
jgi:TonB family protein